MPRHNHHKLETRFTSGWVGFLAGIGWEALAVSEHSLLLFWVGLFFLIVSVVYLTLLYLAVEADRQAWIDEISGRNSE